MTKHNLDERSYVFWLFREFIEYDSEKIRPYLDYINNQRWLLMRHLSMPAIERLATSVTIVCACLDPYACNYCDV